MCIAYPVAPMDSILDKLRRVKFIPKIDSKNAYLQGLTERNSKKYMAFSVPGNGLYQFVTIIPLGLNNAFSLLYRLVEALFGPEFETNVFGYLDDIIVQRTRST